MIRDSRVISTRLLNRAIASLQHPPFLWINASTAIIYRHAFHHPMDQRSVELGGNEPGAPDTWKFSVDVAKAWEQAFFETTTPRTRKVAIRSAMTFSPDDGGVFDVFLGLVRHGLGGHHGSGTQYVSWIHDADFITAVEFLIAHQELSGPINLLHRTHYLMQSSWESCEGRGERQSASQRRTGCWRSGRSSCALILNSCSRAAE